MAEAAGVSVGTVSHALNGTGRVAAATRARVAAVAAELGYRPDPRGRALQSGRTSTLGLVLPAAGGAQRPGEFVDAHFYLELAGAAAQAALARDHALLLLPSPREPEDLERFSFDGALLSDPEDDDPRLSMFDDFGIPVVTLERDAARPDRSWWVAGDNLANTRVLLDHLARVRRPLDRAVDRGEGMELARGHRGGVPRVERAGRDARGGGGGAPPGRATRTSRRPRPGCSSGPRPDAVLAPPEKLACAALEAARAAGLRVPGDVRVAAAVDGPAAQAAGITALDLLPRAHAEAGVELLLARLADGAPEHRYVRAHLRVRASTKP